MICVSIGHCSFGECLELMEKLDFAEIRLDTMKITEEEIEKLFSLKKRLIATCRSISAGNKKREAMLKKAIESGASYVDIDVESGESFKKEIVKKANENNCKVIISYHNFKKTPNRAELEHTVRWCSESGADIVKIACMVKTNQDNARLLSLLDSEKKMVVVGMGEKGKITRVVAPLLGAAFTYASIPGGEKLAPGQMDKDQLEKTMKVLLDD